MVGPAIRRRGWLSIACASSLAGACAEDSVQLPPQLVAHHLWFPLSAADDPFDDRPANVDCPEGGYRVDRLGDEETFEVNTGFCRYITARQSLLGPVSSGERLRVRVWHFAINTAGAGKGHLALRIADRTVWERWIELPTESGLLLDEVVSPADFEAGVPVYYHLHNHGVNDWVLIDFTRAP